MSKFRIYNDTLCPELWDNCSKLDPQVRLNLLQLAYDFYKKTKLPAPIIDIYLMGSGANYNWTPDSDVDVHVIVDFNKFQMPLETVKKTAKTAGAQWNEEHEVLIKGHKVEMNIQNAAEQKSYVTGIFSLTKNQWVRQPSPRRLQIDKPTVQAKYDGMRKYIEGVIRTGNREEMKKAKEYIDAFRQYGLDHYGELSYENIVYKILRSKGLIKHLKDCITAIYDQEMTVKESISESIDWDYKAAEDFMRRRDEQLLKLADLLKSSGGQGRVPWPKVPAARLKRIWLDYGKTGVVRDEKGLEAIADQILTNIARLSASTDMMGHSMVDARQEFEDDYGITFTDQEWEDWMSTYFTNKHGGWLLSDYGLKPLKQIYGKIYKAETAEQKLYWIDRALNIIHQRGDLADMFVQGGSATLNDIFTQGGFTTATDEPKYGYNFGTLEEPEGNEIEEVKWKDIKQSLPRLKGDLSHPMDRDYWDKFDRETNEFRLDRLTMDELVALREKAFRMAHGFESRGKSQWALIHKQDFKKYDAELKRRIAKINQPIAQENESFELTPMKRRQWRDLQNKLREPEDPHKQDAAKAAAEKYLRKTDPNFQVKQNLKASEKARQDFLNNLRQSHAKEEYKPIIQDSLKGWNPLDNFKDFGKFMLGRGWEYYKKAAEEWFNTVHPMHFYIAQKYPRDKAIEYIMKRGDAFGVSRSFCNEGARWFKHFAQELVDRELDDFERAKPNHPVVETRIKWNKEEEGESFYISEDGEYSLIPIYIGRQRVQKWKIKNNKTGAEDYAMNLKDARDKADRMRDPNFVPKTKSYVARGTPEQIAKQMQDNYDYFIKNGQPANAEVVRKNAETVGITLKTAGMPLNEAEWGEITTKGPEELTDADCAALNEMEKDSGIRILSDRELSLAWFVDGKPAGALYTSFRGDKFTFDTIVAREFRGGVLATRIVREGLRQYFQEILPADPEAELELDVVTQKLVKPLEKMGMVVDRTLGYHVIMKWGGKKMSVDETDMIGTSYMGVAQGQSVAGDPRKVTHNDAGMISGVNSENWRYLEKTNAVVWNTEPTEEHKALVTAWLEKKGIKNPTHRVMYKFGEFDEGYGAGDPSTDPIATGRWRVDWGKRKTPKMPPNR
jgi:hypothetical protein